MVKKFKSNSTNRIRFNVDTPMSMVTQRDAENQASRALLLEQRRLARAATVAAERTAYRNLPQSHPRRVRARNTFAKLVRQKWTNTNANAWARKAFMTGQPMRVAFTKYRRPLTVRANRSNIPVEDRPAAAIARLAERDGAMRRWIRSWIRRHRGTPNRGLSEIMLRRPGLPADIASNIRGFLGPVNSTIRAIQGPVPEYLAENTGLYGLGWTGRR